MARSKAYQRDEVLKKAMHLFWKQGYHNTSLQQLETTMGINRYGIYDSFDSKHNLFLTALDRYMGTVGERWYGNLRAEGADLDTIRDFFADVIRSSKSEIGRRGCFACNSISELASADDEVQMRTRRFTESIRLAFLNALEGAQTQHQIPGEIDINSLSRHLTISVLGLYVYAKNGLSPQEFEQAAWAVFETVQ